jgi:hypothetical protein
MAACLNCGAELGGPFCSSCGQRDIPPYPSVRELAVDAFWELSGWDGRFASTVRALIRRPGELTREFLEGRRARYISPLRLYLMCSLVYFLIAAAAPDVRLDDGRTIFMGLRVAGSPPVDSTAGLSRPERVGSAVDESLNKGVELSEAEKAAALEDIKRAPDFMQPFLRRSVSDPEGFKRGILQAMPRMLFALLPVFAAIVALFYRGRKYPEHLYFAIHLHAFVFLALAFNALLKFTQTPWVIAVVALPVLLSIPVYSTVAFRRAYGGTLIATLGKELAIGVLYCAVSFVALILTVYVVSRWG